MSKKKPAGSPARRRPSSPDRRTPQNATRVPQLGAIIQDTEVSYSGPLPPPDMLAEYERISPGMAERLLRTIEIPLEMGQQQQEHRHELERQVVAAGIKQSRRGQIIGALIVLVALVGGIWLISNDYAGEGLASIIVALGGLAGVFVWGDHQQRQERERKAEQARS